MSKKMNINKYYFFMNQLRTPEETKLYLLKKLYMTLEPFKHELNEIVFDDNKLILLDDLVYYAETLRNLYKKEIEGE